MDTKIFLALNFDGGAFLDYIMWTMSHFQIFVFMVLIMIYVLYKNLSRKEFVFSLLGICLVVLFADQTATIFKHNIPFFRPTHTPEIQGLVHTVRDYVGGLYGTVSGHAANSFGLAIYISLISRKRWVIVLFFTFALLTSYSRIYLGVHYPSQILFGTVVGLISGFLSYKIFSLFRKKYSNDNKTTI
ncbi:MAG: phosphatase PAP2 family protein [Bacteroidetes bacterium]|nr:phosphatase PAP2 family protein [Bacteroidota bacterium]